MLGNPRAMIFHHEIQFPDTIFKDLIHPDFDHTPLEGVFDGVRNQVIDDLLQLFRVKGTHAGLHIGTNSHGYVSFLPKWRMQFYRLSDKADQLPWCRAIMGLSKLHLAKLQQLIHQTLHFAGIAKRQSQFLSRVQGMLVLQQTL